MGAAQETVGTYAALTGDEVVLVVYDYWVNETDCTYGLGQLGDFLVGGEMFPLTVCDNDGFDGDEVDFVSHAVLQFRMRLNGRL